MHNYMLKSRPLSNDPRFIQYIYRNRHASTRFVDVYLPSWARSVVFGLILDPHVLIEEQVLAALLEQAHCICCWEMR